MKNLRAMIILISFLILSVSFSVAYETGSKQPARVAVWHAQSRAGAEPIYKSQTTYYSQIITHVETASKNSEVIAIFRHSNNNKNKESIFTHLKQSIDSSTSAMMFPYVYPHPETAAPSSLTRSLSDCEFFKNAQDVTLQKFHEIISDVKSTVLNNGKIDSFSIQLNIGDQDEQKLLSEMQSIAGLLFVAAEETSTHPAPKAAGAYNRILQDQGPGTGNQGTIYYKPEGAEYSIYYANTYLFMTPDLFTGIMTGLFFFFVLIIGLNCLGSIQGPLFFVHKGPSVGREA